MEDATMEKMVTVFDGKPVTNTMILAEGTGNQHKAVIQLVRKYQNDLEEFGRVTFQMAPFETNGGIQNREIAILNEPRAGLPANQPERCHKPVPGWLDVRLKWPAAP